MNGHCLPYWSGGWQAMMSHVGIGIPQSPSRYQHLAWKVRARRLGVWHGETVLGGDGVPPFRIGRGHRGLVGHSRPVSAVLGMEAKVRWEGYREGRAIRPRATTRAAVCRQRCDAELGRALGKLRLIEGEVWVVEGEVPLRGVAVERM